MLATKTNYWQPHANYLTRCYSGPMHRPVTSKFNQPRNLENIYQRSNI